MIPFYVFYLQRRWYNFPIDPLRFLSINPQKLRSPVSVPEDKWSDWRHSGPWPRLLLRHSLTHCPGNIQNQNKNEECFNFLNGSHIAKSQFVPPASSQTWSLWCGPRWILSDQVLLDSDVTLGRWGQNDAKNHVSQDPVLDIIKLKGALSTNAFKLSVLSKGRKWILFQCCSVSKWLHEEGQSV